MNGREVKRRSNTGEELKDKYISEKKKGKQGRKTVENKTLPGTHLNLH